MKNSRRSEHLTECVLMIIHDSLERSEDEKTVFLQFDPSFAQIRLFPNYLNFFT